MSIPSDVVFSRRTLGVIAGVLFLAAIRTQAVILFATDDPTANTTAPMGALANSGWRSEGIFGAFLGTPIAAHYFITAQHIGVQSNVFTYQGAQYDIRQQFDDPASDLRIYRVLQIFPSVAPLYNGTDEIGKHLLVIGRVRGAVPEFFSTELCRAGVGGPAMESRAGVKTTSAPSSRSRVWATCFCLVRSKRPPERSASFLRRFRGSFVHRRCRRLETRRDQLRRGRSVLHGCGGRRRFSRRAFR